MRTTMNKDKDQGGPVRTRGERGGVEQQGVAHAMVDALEDILKWERASERAMRTAPVKH